MFDAQEMKEARASLRSVVHQVAVPLCCAASFFDVSDDRILRAVTQPEVQCIQIDGSVPAISVGAFREWLVANPDASPMP